MSKSNEISKQDLQEVIAPKESSIVIYTTEDGKVQLDVQIDQDTAWLSIDQMAQLFGRDRTVIGRHIAHVFEQGEVKPEVGCANFAHTTQHESIIASRASLFENVGERYAIGQTD